MTLTNPVPTMLGRLDAIRAELHRLERDEHPDITDHHGRVWVWRSHDRYVHDGMSAPREFILDGRVGLPQAGLTERNQNYADLCSVCRRESTPAEIEAVAS